MRPSKDEHQVALGGTGAFDELGQSLLSRKLDQRQLPLPGAAFSPGGRILLRVHVGHQHGEARLSGQGPETAAQHGFALPAPIDGDRYDFCAHGPNTTIAIVHKFYAA